MILRAWFLDWALKALQRGQKQPTAVVILLTSPFLSEGPYI